MPQRTITAAGGSISAAGTYVEGIAPTTSDFIVGTATSGPLTVNSSITVQYMDLSAYTNTITFSTTNILACNLASSTTIFGSGTTVAGTGTFRLGNASGGATLDYRTTSRLPNFSSTGGNLVIAGDIYCNSFDKGINSGTISGNGRILNFGNLAITTPTTLSSTAEIHQKGTGTLDVSTLTGAGALVLDSTGTTTFQGSFLSCVNGFNIRYSAGTMTNPRIIWTPSVASTIALNTSGMTWQQFNYNSATSPLTNTILMNQQFNCQQFYYPTRSTTGQDILQFSGASPLNITDKFFIASSSASAFTDTTNDELRFVTGTTHSINQIWAYLLPQNNFTIRSVTSGSKATLNLGDRLNSPIFYVKFTDINANGGQNIRTYNGTVTNSDNITSYSTNIFSTGGGTFAYIT